MYIHPRSLTWTFIFQPFLFFKSGSMLNFRAVVLFGLRTLHTQKKSHESLHPTSPILTYIASSCFNCGGSDASMVCFKRCNKTSSGVSSTSSKFIKREEKKMFTTPQGGPLLTSHKWKYTYVTPIDLPHELYVTEVVTIQISIYNWFSGAHRQTEPLFFLILG